MYSAGFYPFPTEEEKWGYWSKHAYLNRIEPEALPLYQQIFELVKEKPHFILTTNVDHQFWKAGFMDERIFATQGDYATTKCMMQKSCLEKWEKQEKTVKSRQNWFPNVRSAEGTWPCICDLTSIL